MENAPVASVVNPPVKPARPWAVFASGAFRNLWAALALSLIGDFFSYIAIAWLVLQLTGSSLALGSVLVAGAVPRAILMLVGGALVDRLSARVTMLGSMGLRVLCVAPLAVLVFTGRVQLWEIYAISIVFGIVEALFMPARGAILPQVVADEQLEPGNAVLNVTAQACIIVGPAIAGVVVASLGIGWAFAADAACFALGFVFLLLLRATTSPVDKPAASGGGMGGQIVAGFRYAWSHVGIRAMLFIIAGIDFAANGALGVGLPTLAHGRFAAGAAGLGILFGAWGVGATAGAVISGFVPPPKRFGLLVIAISAWLGICIFVEGFLSSLILGAVAMGLAGIATGVVNTYGISWLQRRVDPEMQGRVMSLVMLASMGLTPIAYAASGAIADVNVTVLFVACGGLILLTAAAAAASRSVRAL
jgi:MFS family permease